MKPSVLYEIVAIMLALVGVLVFGFALFPILNPIQYRLHFDPDYFLLHLFCVPVSVLVMWYAWRLTRKAKQLKHVEEILDSPNQ